MFKKFFRSFIEIVKEEYRFILFLVFLYIVLQYPVNYYITIGGGSSDISSRIKVDKAYPAKGSLSISYVTQLEGSILTYGLSYIIPGWERENANDYKYDEKESIDDIEFRSDLDLTTANGTATYWAYTLAHKEVEKTEAKLYVIAIFDKYQTALKVQDQIISVDGYTFDTIQEYKDYLQTKNKGDIVEIKIIRKGKEKIIKAKLFEENNRIILGVGLQYAKSYKTNPKVKIKFKKSESGPSGGLITTLEIYNQLTKKDITGGNKIAGTGTIEENGMIGQIGGVEHKVLGASKDKIDYFLVPDGQNYKDALKYIKSKKLKIKLIKVKNINDAIEKLKKL